MIKRSAVPPPANPQPPRNSWFCSDRPTGRRDHDGAHAEVWSEPMPTVARDRCPSEPVTAGPGMVSTRPRCSPTPGHGSVSHSMTWLDAVDGRNDHRNPAVSLDLLASVLATEREPQLRHAGVAGSPPPPHNGTIFQLSPPPPPQAVKQRPSVAEQQPSPKMRRIIKSLPEINTLADQASSARRRTVGHDLRCDEHQQLGAVAVSDLVLEQVAQIRHIAQEAVPC